MNIFPVEVALAKAAISSALGMSISGSEKYPVEAASAKELMLSLSTSGLGNFLNHSYAASLYPFNTNTTIHIVGDFLFKIGPFSVAFFKWVRIRLRA